MARSLVRFAAWHRTPGQRAGDMKKIWNELKSALGGDQSETEDTEVAHHAAAALMIEMCESDMKTEPEELAAVAQSLQQVFELDPDEVQRMIAEARRNNRADISYFPHVETVNRLCGQEEKAQIVRSLWQVAAADGRLDKYEEHYLRRLCELIHVPHRLFIQTRHEVFGD